MSDPMITAASGAIAQSQALDVLADNLANINTPGFKGSNLTFRQVVAATSPSGSPTQVQVEVSGIVTDFSQGSMRRTDNPLDIALMGDGFFVVKTPDGERLTRNGALHINEMGELATTSGDLIMGAGGPVRVQGGVPLHIDAQGGVWSHDTLVDKLQVATVAKPDQLVRQGDGLWRYPPNTQLTPLRTAVQSGVIEGANVKPVQLMTQLIWVQRAYEIYHRAIEISHSVDQKITGGIA